MVQVQKRPDLHLEARFTPVQVQKCLDLHLEDLFCYA